MGDLNVNSKEQKTILLVEDEAVTAMLESKELEKHGYNIIHVLNGEDAIVTILKQELSIDLILMDIDLGKEPDGTETANIILKKKDIPIIFLSSHTEPEIVEKTENISSYGYVVKNSGITVLDASIKMAFKLFKEKQNVREHQKDLSAANEELEASFEEMEATNKMLIESQKEILNREEMLIKSETRLKGAERLAKLGHWELELKENELHWSEEIFEIFEIDSSQFKASYEAFLEMVHPEDRDNLNSAYTESVKNKTPYSIDHRILLKDGRIKHVNEQCETFYDKGGNAERSLGTVQDITERKKVEETIIEKNNYIDLIIESSVLSTWISDEKGTVMRINPAALEFFGASEDEVMGKYNLFQDAVIEEKGFMPVVRKVFEQGVADSIVIDYDFKAVEHVDVKNATHKIIKSIFTPILNNNGKVSNVIVQAIDLTDIIKTEQELKKTLEEKNILFKELQHRSKNSFQMISSMVSLVSDSSLSQEVKSVLDDMNSRIIAVSEMYSLLYESDSVTVVQLDEYLGRVISSLPGLSENITLKNMFDVITVSVKIAIPLGIILVELITNSIKHAFWETNKATITVLLKKIDSSVILEVKDNGVGLPVGFDIETTKSLGLKLVSALVEQIDGSFKVDGSNRTCCIIEFSVL